jgi:hypothetical protein
VLKLTISFVLLPMAVLSKCFIKSLKYIEVISFCSMVESIAYWPLQYVHSLNTLIKIFLVINLEIPPIHFNFYPDI